MIIRISESKEEQKRSKNNLKNYIAILSLGIIITILFSYNISYEIRLKHRVDPDLIISIPIVITLIIIYIKVLIVNYLEINNNKKVMENFWKKIIRNKRIPKIEMFTYDCFLDNDYISFEMSDGIFHLSLTISIPLNTFKSYLLGSLVYDNRNRFQEDISLKFIDQYAIIEDQTIDLNFLYRIFKEQKPRIISGMKVLSFLAGSEIGSKELIHKMLLWHGK